MFLRHLHGVFMEIGHEQKLLYSFSGVVMTLRSKRVYCISIEKAV